MNNKEKTIFDLFKKYAYGVISEPSYKLKYPFTIPGLSYKNTLWDWDSYFIIYALNDITEVLKEDSDFDYIKYRKLVNDAAKGNVLNFLDFMEDDGFVPIMLRADYYDDTYCTRYNVKNSQKGFLIKSALLAAKLNNDYSWIDIEKLERYFKYLKNNQFDIKCGLYYFKADIMIGIDNNPTVFGRTDSSTADIFLNSSMVDEFSSMIEILKNLNINFDYYLNEKNNLIQSMDKEMWDIKDSLYYSQDINVKTNKTDVFNTGLGAFWNTMPLKIEYIGCYFPLLYDYLDKDKAIKIVNNLKKDSMMSNYGIRSLSKFEKMYNLSPSGNPSNWLGSIWGISNYIAFKGFSDNSLNNEAIEIYNKTVDLFYNSIIKDGSMWESYNPETGEGILNKMFFGWNMLVGSMFRLISKK